MWVQVKKLFFIQVFRVCLKLLRLLSDVVAIGRFIKAKSNRVCSICFHTSIDRNFSFYHMLYKTNQSSEKSVHIKVKHRLPQKSYKLIICTLKS